MSYIDTLEQAAETARNASETASEASQILHGVAHGDDTSTVSTESGPVKTVAKAIKDIQDEVLGGVISPVREVITASADQATFNFEDISTASTTVYVNGILRIDFTIDSESQITFDSPLSEGDVIVAIERHLDNDTNNVLTVAQGYADQAQNSAQEASDTFSDIQQAQQEVQASVAEASTYVTQAANITDDARGLAQNAETQIQAAVNDGLSTLESTRSQSVSQLESAVDDYLQSQDVFSGDYRDLTNIPDFGSAALQETSEFATSAQGEKADNAVQSQGITQIVKLTRTEYENIADKDEQTLYIIQG